MVTQHRYRINEEITAPELRVVDAQGRTVGIMRRREALEYAHQMGLDLIEIAPQAQPPVCKLMDYSKFAYELQKRERYQRRQQQQHQLKEIRFKSNTDIHDFNFKVRHAREFLLGGHKVKATVLFRGREILYPERGEDLLQRFWLAVEDIAKLDQPAKLEGKMMTLIASPDRAKIQRKQTEERIVGRSSEASS
ncbi:MAG: translation initiation factor IF-3 [Candidatus Kapabacteria bacterium]|nr:translation initiation factor IF-3 [Candidatus Kapabacteria bacterium]